MASDFVKALTNMFVNFSLASVNIRICEYTTIYAYICASCK